jgi:hypothetical protein
VKASYFLLILTFFLLFFSPLENNKSEDLASGDFSDLFIIFLKEETSKPCSQLSTTVFRPHQLFNSFHNNWSGEHSFNFFIEKIVSSTFLRC